MTTADEELWTCSECSEGVPDRLWGIHAEAHRFESDHITPVGGWIVICALFLVVVAAIVWRLHAVAELAELRRAVRVVRKAIIRNAAILGERPVLTVGMDRGSVVIRDEAGKIRRRYCPAGAVAAAAETEELARREAARLDLACKVPGCDWRGASDPTRPHGLRPEWALEVHMVNDHGWPPRPPKPPKDREYA